MTCMRWIDSNDATHCDDCRRMAADAARIAALVDPPVPSGAWARLQGRRPGALLARVAAALLVTALPVALWKVSKPTPRFEVEVVDVDESPDPTAWFSILTQHADSDAVPMVPPAVEEE